MNVIELIDRYVKTKYEIRKYEKFIINIDFDMETYGGNDNNSLFKANKPSWQIEYVETIKKDKKIYEEKLIELNSIYIEIENALNLSLSKLSEKDILENISSIDERIEECYRRIEDINSQKTNSEKEDIPIGVKFTIMMENQELEHKMSEERVLINNYELVKESLSKRINLNNKTK